MECDLAWLTTCMKTGRPVRAKRYFTMAVVVTVTKVAGGLEDMIDPMHSGTGLLRHSMLLEMSSKK